MPPFDSLGALQRPQTPTPKNNDLEHQIPEIQSPESKGETT